MKATATAPVPAHSRLVEMDTVELPGVQVCPPWCIDHSQISPLALGEGPIEIHRARRSVTTAVTDLGMVETHKIDVAVERYDYDCPEGSPAATVVLGASGNTPMTSAQARAIAAALVWAANTLDGAR